MWFPAHFMAMPQAALAALADIYNDIDREMCLPWQALLNLIALIPKPAGGDRPIALTTVIYAVWVRIRQPMLRQWEEAKAGF